MDTRPEPEDPRPSPPDRWRVTVSFKEATDNLIDLTYKPIFSMPTCPNTGEGEEPVVMVAGVKAERCRSCAEGTLSEGF